LHGSFYSQKKKNMHNNEENKLYVMQDVSINYIMLVYSSPFPVSPIIMLKYMFFHLAEVLKTEIIIKG